MILASHPVRRVVDAARRWPVESQLHARRNALVASTALAQRRAERDEVEELLASLGRTRLPQPAVVAAHR